MATMAADRPERSDFLVRLMTEGGDERISLDPVSGLNHYLCAPRPRRIVAYSSSTANDISPAAFDHIAGLPPLPSSAVGYAARLQALRKRIRAAYRLDEDIAIVFAPSGTDLEYVALACAPGAGRLPLMNILLGADEIGSGCVHSAGGRHFGARTALGVATSPGAPITGIPAEQITMVDVPVRDRDGRARGSEEIVAAIESSLLTAKAAGLHAIVHVVHGSKTGLISPDLAAIDQLRARHGAAVGWAVDACQARIGPAEIGAYLARGATVFLTGSKFIGGPPFSGFALVPPAVMAGASPLPPGFGSVYYRGEWPSCWPGAERLPAGTNPGLLLRLEAALFELDRFGLLPAARVEGVVNAFRTAIGDLVVGLGISQVTEAADSDCSLPGSGIEAHTLATLDLSSLAPGADFNDVQRWHRAMIVRGLRMGQPARCGKLADGRWKPSLRVALSMPLIVERASEDDQAIATHFSRDFSLFASALRDCIAGVR